jgi:hypothetical protein
MDIAEVTKLIPFDEQNLRKFGGVVEAVKVYVAQGIPQRRVVLQYQKVNTVRQGNVSINGQYYQSLPSEKQQEFINSVFRRNDTRIKLFQKEFILWRDKFSGRVDTKKTSKASQVTTTEKTVVDETLKSDTGTV